MRRFPIAVACLATLIGCASFPSTQPPTDAKIASLESMRVLEPFVETAVNGQRYVEFAPSAETRNIACVPDGTTFASAYESRTRGYFDKVWEPWKTRTMIVTWNSRIGCWVAGWDVIRL